MDTDVYSYLRTHATELGSRILETYPPFSRHERSCCAAHCDASAARHCLPRHLRSRAQPSTCAKQGSTDRCRCGAGKTYMALGTIHVLAEGRPSTTLVMCPSHITPQVGA